MIVGECSVHNAVRTSHGRSRSPHGERGLKCQPGGGLHRQGRAALLTESVD